MDSIRHIFQEQFHAEPAFVVRAPGRVNLIGEHTDYNDGFVLPMAIDCETRIAVRPRTDRLIQIHAANLGRNACIDLDAIQRNAEEPWSDYIAGVAQELGHLGHPTSGFDAVVKGNIPVGAGLSSSASIEMAALVAMEELGEFRLDGVAAAQLGQRVENHFLGLSSGVMDQFICRNARAAHALFLDCRSFATRHIAIAFVDAVFVIADTGVSRGLAASKYNERVEECGRAVHTMSTYLEKRPPLKLRDFTTDELEECRQELDPIAYHRARHVIMENERTRQACEALARGDALRMGVLMNESHDSLANDYEVSCIELDIMVGLARNLPGCLGARLTGAGFGGCTVHLVRSEQLNAFCEKLQERYHDKTGKTARIIASHAASGAGLWPA